ncbi:MAG: pilus assembly protein N-terminal domain-containing protein [Candidatus Doudnabacteria bacterium]|jgi:hypothetical protein
MVKRYLILIASIVFLFTGASQTYASQMLTESIGAGKTLSVGLNVSSTGNWYIVSNSNPSVATAELNSSPSVIVKGLTAGTTQVMACTETSGVNCLTLNVNVTGNVLGASIVGAHPAGSWVISGQTVFYVTSQGLIPITTWKIFLSNGGTSKLIQPINSADEHLPMLSLMILKDSRVK